MYLLEQVRNQVALALASLTPNAAQHATRVTATRDAALGDYQANVVFALAKELDRDPEPLANQIAASLAQSELFEHIEVARKGFINMRLRESVILKMLVDAASDGRCGVGQVESPRNFVVDFSSPNVAKPMHVGHIRSTVIGDAITRTLRFVGHHVVTDNHLGDWGTQFGMIIFGFKNFADPTNYQADPVVELTRLYRLVQQLIGYQSALKQTDTLKQNVNPAETAYQAARVLLEADASNKSLLKSERMSQRKLTAAQDDLQQAEQKIAAVQADPMLLRFAQEHPTIEQAALAETAALHGGDETNIGLWQRFMPHCLAVIHAVYESLNVSFDHELGESFYNDRLGDVVKQLEAKGLAKLSDGAMCVFLDGFEAPMIVQKQDGAYLYATTDLATVQYRVEKFDPDAILYVVDHRQSEHFQKLFLAVRAMGYDELELRHISFGTVLGEDNKPFKTRSGDVVGLESLLQDAIDRASSIVCNPERLEKAAIQMEPDEQESVATVVGLGAIKYADLSHNRTSDYVFNLQKMIQLEGNTATYVQYSYARAASILRKINDASDGIEEGNVPSVEQIAIIHPAERALALQLLRFEEFIHGSLSDFMPNILADYLYETARQFASFFDQCPVLKAETPTSAATRTLLVNLTAQTLQTGLDLLGISVVGRM